MYSDNTAYWKRNVAMMWFSQILVLTGFAAMMPFIPLFLKDQLGIMGESERGVYMSMFYFFGTLGYAVFLPIWGMLSDKYGVKPMLYRGTFLTAFLFPLMGFVNNVWMLIFLRFLTAACAGTTSAAQTLLVKTTPDERQGLALGVLSTAVYAGTMLGNVVGGLVVHYYGYRATFIFCGILYFFAGISIFFARENLSIRAPRMRPVRMHHDILAKHGHLYSRLHLPRFTISVWIMLGLFCILGMVRNFEIPYVAMLVEQIVEPGQAAYWTGIISAFVAVGAFLSGLMIGYLADCLKPRTLIVPCLVISAVGLVVQAMSTNLWTLGISRTIMFFAAGGLQPVFQKILSGVTPPRKRGTVFGWASTFSSAGTMFSTLIAGWVILVFRTRGVFVAAALMCLLMIPLSLHGVQRALKRHHPGC